MNSSPSANPCRPTFRPKTGPTWARRWVGLPYFILTSWLATVGWAAPEKTATLEVIKDGKALQLVYPEKAASPSSDGKKIILQDRKQNYLVNARLGDSFTLKIRMAILKGSRSASTLVLIHGEEASHLGFAGSKDTMFVQGKAFSSATISSLKDRPPPPFIAENSMFDVVISYHRIGPDLVDLDITLNGEPYVRQSGKGPPITAVGLRPWSGIIQIESMTLEGEFEKGGVQAKPFQAKETEGQTT